MKLLEEGRITLQDPLTAGSRIYRPGRKTSESQPADPTLGTRRCELSAADAMKSAIRKIAEQKCLHRPAAVSTTPTQLILLGELVLRVQALPGQILPDQL